MKKIFAVVILICLPVAGQEIKVPAGFDELGAKAKENVNITLDRDTLAMAGKFLSGDKGNDAKLKELVAGVRAIYVRSFEFDKPNQYSKKDLDAFRAQFRAPGWSKIVEVQSKEDNEHTEIHIKKDGKQIAGLAIIAAEPEELTLVLIDGPMDPSKLAELGGNFGIPRIEMGPKVSLPKD